MKKYYLHNGSENIGPFELEELKEKKLTKDTPVWYDGIEDWTTVGNVEELKTIITPLPPPIKKTVEEPVQKSSPKVEAEKKKTNWFRQLVKLILILIVVFAIIGGIINLTENNSYNAPSYKESVMTIAETEAASPVNYLTATGNYHQNFLGTKLKIDGSIENKATVTTYKDVVLKVTFYSETNTAIGSENYTIYEYFTPTSTKPFHLKVKNYSNVETIGVDVVGGVVK